MNQLALFLMRKSKTLWIFISETLLYPIDSFRWYRVARYIENDPSFSSSFMRLGIYGIIGLAMAGFGAYAWFGDLDLTFRLWVVALIPYFIAMKMQKRYVNAYAGRLLKAAFKRLLHKWGRKWRPIK